MKTLDEVIKAMTICKNPDINRNCKDCPMPDTQECMGVLMTDALHYLREYRAEKANLEIIKGNYQDAIENCDKAENKFKIALKKLDIGTLNDPLTWEDLKEKTGKPVWYEVINEKALPALDPSGWGIVGCWSFKTWEGVECLSLVRPGVTYALPVAEYGKTWQAYRRERE